jgi:hypothetical protein
MSYPIFPMASFSRAQIVEIGGRALLDEVQRALGFTDDNCPPILKFAWPIGEPFGITKRIDDAFRSYCKKYESSPGHVSFVMGRLRYAAV